MTSPLIEAGKDCIVECLLQKEARKSLDAEGTATIVFDRGAPSNDPF